MDNNEADDQMFGRLKKDMEAQAAQTQERLEKAVKDAQADPCKDNVFYSSCRATVQDIARQPVRDLDAPPSPWPGVGYAAVGIVLVFLIYAVCARYRRTMGEGLSRWVLRPVSRKAARGGRTLRTWWLED